jgi:nicotinamide phosphoribosyltransferase
MTIQPVTLIDGYKVDHRRQYPEGTETILSNATARKTRRDGVEKVVFFSLQYFIKEYLMKQWRENFFEKDIEEVISKFNRRINNYLGPNKVGDQHIRDLHKLGYLPIRILALPEGTEYPIKVPCLVIHNTDTNFGWLTNYLETILSTTIWGGCTSATTALQYKKLLNKFALETVGNTDFVQWQGHDFSFRGMFGLEAACMSGAGHLLSFTGTDTIPAIEFLEQYYNADCEKELIGGSVAATEHSVACTQIGNATHKYYGVHEELDEVTGEYKIVKVLTKEEFHSVSSIDSL